MISAAPVSRGDLWCAVLFAEAQRTVAGTPPSVRVIDGAFGGAAWRAIGVVPDARGRFARARGGELGLDEALAVADAVRGAPAGHAVIAIVDVPGQAFGRREEAAGLHVALAAAVEAYVEERRAGRPVFALAVGKAISGAFLAHGLQAGWIGALRDPDVEVHVMSAQSVARVTRSSAEDLARIAGVVPATARDIATFAAFGAVDALFEVADASRPSVEEVDAVRTALVAARDAGLGVRAPRARRDAPRAQQTRACARDVRARIAAEWDR
ncbi:MAG: biotin-independent malonate decarboxylase subunit gamma [Candidatus Velthaea sp.]